MGDVAPAQCTIHAITEKPPHKMGPAWLPSDVHREILDLFRQYGFTEIFVQSEDTPDIITDTKVRLGAVYVGYEVRAAIEDDLGPKLDELGCTYEINADAFGEYDAVVRYGTPHLGVFESPASSTDYLPTIGTNQVQAIIAECDTYQELVDALSLATGKAWRDYFTRAQLPPTDEDMRLARLSLLRAEEALADG